MHFSLSKVWSADDADAVVLDADLRISGSEPLAVVAITLVGGVQTVIQLAALQLSAVARVKLGPLVGAIPCFGAVSVSLIGEPFLDFSLTALSGDLMAVPGLTGLVSSQVKKALNAFIYPQRLVIPVMKGVESYLGLMPRATGVLLVSVARARGLPGLGPRSTLNPFVVLRVAGQTCSATSPVQKGTRTPAWGFSASLPCVDPFAQTLEVELWDHGVLTSNELVSTTRFRLGATLGGPESGPPGVFCGWLPLAPYAPASLASASGLVAGAGNLVGSGVGVVSSGFGAVVRARGQEIVVAVMTRPLTSHRQGSSIGAVGGGIRGLVVSSPTAVVVSTPDGPALLTAPIAAASKGGDIYLQLAFAPFLPLRADPPAPVAAAAAAAAPAVAAPPSSAAAAAPAPPAPPAAAVAPSPSLAMPAPPAASSTPAPPAVLPSSAHAAPPPAPPAPPPPAPPPPPPPPLPRGFAHPPGGCYLSVRLLRCERLVPPPRFGRMEPVVTFRLGDALRTSTPVAGASPSYNEAFEFPDVDPLKTPLLRFDVAAGPPKGALTGAVGGAVGGVVSGVGGLVGGVASMATLGAVSVGCVLVLRETYRCFIHIHCFTTHPPPSRPPSGGAGDLQLNGATGGVTRRAQPDADAHAAASGVAAGGPASAALPPQLPPASFCGRGTLRLADVAARCAIEGGPYVESVFLSDVPGGSIVIALELRTLAPIIISDVPTPEEAAAAAAGAAAPASPRSLPGTPKSALRSRGSRVEVMSPGGGGGGGMSEEDDEDARADADAQRRAWRCVTPRAGASRGGGAAAHAASPRAVGHAA